MKIKGIKLQLFGISLILSAITLSLTSDNAYTYQVYSLIIWLLGIALNVIGLIKKDD